MKTKVNIGSSTNRGASVGIKTNTSSLVSRTMTGKNTSLEDQPVMLNVTEAASRKDPVSEKYRVLGTDTTLPSITSDASMITKNIYIGNYNAASNKEWLLSTGITHIVNAAKEIPALFPDDFHYLAAAMTDTTERTLTSDDLMRIAEPSYRYISGVIRLNPNAKILIHCRAGISRSVSIGVYYLMRSRGINYDDALQIIKERRPIARPNSWYEKQLRDIGKMFEGILA